MSQEHTVLALSLVFFVMLSACKKEVRETDEYKAGWNDGYEEGVYEVCEAWRRTLPDGLYSHYEPRACR